MGVCELKRALQIVVVLALCSLQVACQKRVRESDRPTSHYLNDQDPCVRASAQAIIKSGLPYPNVVLMPVTVPVPDVRIKTVDMWVGPTRFVIPGERSNRGGYADNHPRRFQGLNGTLPNFYPVGPAAPVKHGMDAMVYVRFLCSMDESYTSTWGGPPKAQEELIEVVRADLQKDLLTLPDHPGTVTVSRRDDIRMIEIFARRQREPTGKAIYFPIDRPLIGLDGKLSAIGCARRHDPDGLQYGGRGWRCSSGMRITPNIVLQIDIYVSHLIHMPSVFYQVQQLILTAQQPAQE